MSISVIPAKAGIQSMPIIWSPWLRMLHWLLAISTILAFASHEGTSPLHEWHEVFGYVALATAASRILLGFAGSAAHSEWRFSSFVRSIKTTANYTQDLASGQETRHRGHNPLGAWMVVALLTNSILCGVTGWLFTTNMFFGYAWLAKIHELSGEAFVPLVILHLIGVFYASWRHKESLVDAMIHGKKRT
jgi:cytochrome b